MNTITITSTLAGAAALGVLTTALAATSSPAPTVVGSDSAETTLTFRLAKDVEQKHVDIGPKGDSVGDRYVVAVSLRSGSQVAGRLQNECTVLDNKYEGHLCDMALVIDGGWITLQAGGVRKAVPNVGGRGETYAITGGTGVYAGASGTFVPSEDGKRVIITLAP